MAVNALVGNLTWGSADAAGTTYTIDLGTGFDPKIMRLTMVGIDSATDGVFNNTANVSRGFATGTASRRCVGMNSSHGAATSVTSRGHRNDAVLVQLGADVTAGLLDVTTWASNQIVLRVDTTLFGTSDYAVVYEIVGGSDIGNVAIGDFLSPTTTGPQAITDPGFTPVGVEFLAAGFNYDGGLSPPVINGANAQGGIMIGAAAGSGAGEQAVVHTIHRDAQLAADTYGYGLAGECIAGLQTNGAVLEKASFSSFDAGQGFTVNWTTVADFNATLVSYLCWDGAETEVGSFLSRTSIEQFTEAVGFEPVTASFLSALRPESTTGTSTAHAALSMGASDGTNARVQAVLDVDAADPMDVTIAIDYDKVYMDLSDATVDGLIALTSYQSASPEMTLDQTDADPAANFVMYIALGAAVGGALSNDRLADMAFCRGRLPFGPGRLPVPDGTIS